MNCLFSEVLPSKETKTIDKLGIVDKGNHSEIAFSKLVGFGL